MKKREFLTDNVKNMKDDCKGESEMKTDRKNKIKKIMALSMAGILSLGILAGCKNKTGDVREIGISQLVEHPALDLSREGFIEGLKDEGFEDGKNIKIDVQNAQGDIPTAQSIANKFKNDSKSLIFAIATPAAQAAKNSTSEIPVVFTAVTDPVSAKLVKSNKKPGGNITGTSDFQGMDKTVQTIRKVVPDAKTIGVAFNTSEINSRRQVDMLKKEAAKEGMKVVDLGISSTNEVSQAISVLDKKSDVILTLTDNLIAGSIPAVVETAMKDKKPVIGSEEAHVQKGAVAANSISYREIGKEAGIIAGKILKGEKAGNIPVEFAKSSKIMVNRKSMEKLGLKVDGIDNVKFID